MNTGSCSAGAGTARFLLPSLLHLTCCSNKSMPQDKPLPLAAASVEGPPTPASAAHLVQDAHCIAACQRVAHISGCPHAASQQAAASASAAVNQRCQQPHAAQRLVQPQLQPRQRQVRPGCSSRLVACDSSGAAVPTRAGTVQGVTSQMYRQFWCLQDADARHGWSTGASSTAPTPCRAILHSPFCAGAVAAWILQAHML